MPIFWLALAVLLHAPVAQAASSNELEAKIALESSLEKRLSAVLKAVLGTDDLIVIVNAEVLPEGERDPEVMPGVPAKQSPAVPAALALSLSQVRRISATLMVDTSTAEADVKLIKQVASGILGLSPDRGDVLAVEKIKFHRDRVELGPAALLRSPAAAVALLWLAVGGVVFLLLYRRFLRPLLGLMGDLIAAVTTGLQQRFSGGAEAEDDGPDAAPAPVPAAALLSASNGASGKDAPPFAFVHEQHMLRLIYLLRQAPPLTVATVLQYLSPDCATKVMAALDAGARREVVGLMSKVTLLDEASVRAVEADLRKKIDYMLGGEDKLVELLGSLPGPLQQDLLQGVEAKDPGLARRLRDKIVFIEDLGALEPAEIKALSRRVSIRSLARVLKASPALTARILPKLAHGMREWLAEEIRLYTDAAPEQVELERRRVLDAFMQLIREGKAALRKPSAGSTSTIPPAPAPKPAVEAKQNGK